MNYAPCNIPLTIYQGNDFTKTVSLVINGLPFAELDNATSVLFAVKKSLYDSTLLFSVPIVKTDPGNTWTNGVLKIALPAIQTAKLTQDCHYDLLVELPSQVITPIHGPVSVKRRVAFAS